jgi:hypothetical protein
VGGSGGIPAWVWGAIAVVAVVVIGAVVMSRRNRDDEDLA